LLLVRGGESLWEHENRLHGRTDLPMSEPGRSQLLVDITRLRWMSGGTIYHPADESSAETAHLLAERFQGRAKPVADLAEPDLGLLEGLSMEEFAERFPKRFKQWEEDPIHLTPPEGEEMPSARDRILAAVEAILAKPRTAEFAIVLHPVALAMTRAALAMRPAGHLWSLLEGRPRFERYIVPDDGAQRLQSLASAPA
jgi:broad specificity phosphatase PhoE